MAYGVKDTDGKLIMVTNKPYYDNKKNKEFTLSNREFVAKVVRCATLLPPVGPKDYPKPKQWVTKKLLQYLDGHSITNPNKLAFF